jgi:hypothetical protein
MRAILTNENRNLSGEEREHYALKLAVVHSSYSRVRSRWTQGMVIAAQMPAHKNGMTHPTYCQLAFVPGHHHAMWGYVQRKQRLSES